MEGAPSDPSHELIAADRRMDQCYRLFNRQRSLHQIIGGGRVPFPLTLEQAFRCCYSPNVDRAQMIQIQLHSFLAVVMEIQLCEDLKNPLPLERLDVDFGNHAADVLLWRCRWVSIAVVSAATIAWLLFERSGLSFLTICSDVLLILIVIQFVWAKSAENTLIDLWHFLLGRPLQPLPELVLTEEMVNDAAVSFRVKFNNLLMMAHDITLGKDFRIFFQVVGMLWILSIVGSFFSFFTLAYIGIILSFTIPVLYNKYEVHVDKCAGFVHRKFSKHYKIVDENVISKLPRRFSKNKDA
ncbi:hypothetical protein ZIOFF_009606 [Zingiber officinale]|uniref:Reticulon-like protein n=1 Tax=Zingiber officinale TaxID=94328 RepID=A0A8J5HHY7_ZINOF|nr:hypothetical protein ZIOFF_009606 [Zingiber officinale]